jgi:hypothetical protein
MENIFRKTAIAILITFAFSITGCLSNNVNQPSAKAEVTDSKKEPVVNPNVKPTTDPTTKPLTVYNPLGNRAPMVTQFVIEELDKPVVVQGQTVELKASGIDPEGANVTIIYEATGGQISGNKWTAPTRGGIFQIKAIATDGVIKSEPSIIEISVPGKVGGIQVGSLAVNRIAKQNGPSRAISATTATPTSNKALLETNEQIEIVLVYTTTTTGISVAPYAAEGSLAIKTWDNVGTGNVYTHTYTYTAPSAVPTGEVTTLTFDIVNPSDITDYAQVTATFIINQPPTILSANFGGTSPTSITPNNTKTITVTASDTSTDSLTYSFETFVDGTAVNEGTLSETTNTTGTVSYTSSNNAGTEKVLIIVTDQRGANAQYTFSCTVAAPMYAFIADDNAANYAAVSTDNLTVISTVDVTTKDNGSSVELSTPWNTSDASSLESSFDDGIEIFTSNVPSGTATYAWTATAGTKTLLATAALSSATVVNPALYTIYPGALTLSGTATDSVDTNISTIATETIYVNEPSVLDNIYYLDSEGNVVSLWDGTSQPTTKPQFSPGQLVSVSTTVSDADNTRVTDQTTDAAGYFSDTSAKFLVKVIDTDGTTFVNSNTDLEINTTSGYTNGGTAAGTIDSTISPFNLTVGSDASLSTADAPKKLVIRVRDGYDNIADGTAANAITTDFSTTVGPDVDGIAKAPASTNTLAILVDAAPATMDYRGIRIGYDMTKTHFNGDFYLAKTSTADTWKIYDVTAGAYIKDSTGSDITIDDSAAHHNSVLAITEVTATNDALPAPYDWLLIDTGALIQAAGGSGTNGYTSTTVYDKVYFKTYADQVVIPLDVVIGPRISTVVYNKYVTLGENSDIIVYAGNTTSLTNPTGAAAVSLVHTSSEGGTFVQGTEADSDAITGEYWTYTAPSSYTSGTVTFIVTITDTVDPTKKVSSTYSFYLNRKPVIGSVVGNSTVDTTDGLWIKKGTQNIALATTVTDPDTTDTFGYIWSTPNENNGTMKFASTSSGIWNPYNGNTALTATGGPYSNGKYPIQLTVYDKDAVGAGKGGTDTETIVVGINENPEVGSGNTDGLQLTKKNLLTSYSSTNGPAWYDRVATAGDDPLDDDGTVGNGLGTTTLDFSGAVQLGAAGDNIAFTATAFTITTGSATALFSTYLQAGDKILVKNAEDTGNNGVYTVASSNATVITVTEATPVTNLTDTTATIYRLEAQYPNVRVAVEPQGVTDEVDDRDSLNYTFYMTADTASGSPITTETFSYTSVVDDQTNLSIKGLDWKVSEGLRGNGGTNFLHFRVSDDKYGVAKGIVDYTEKLLINPDVTGPEINERGDVTIKLNGAATTGADLKIGDQVTIRVNRAWANSADMETVSVDVSALYGNFGQKVFDLITATPATFATAATITSAGSTFQLTFVAGDKFYVDGSLTNKNDGIYTVAAAVAGTLTTVEANFVVEAAQNIKIYKIVGDPKSNVIELAFNTGSDANDPSDDYWESTIVITESGVDGVGPVDDARATLDYEIRNLKGTDIFGNVGNAIDYVVDQKVDGLGTNDNGTFGLDNVKLLTHDGYNIAKGLTLTNVGGVFTNGTATNVWTNELSVGDMVQIIPAAPGLPAESGVFEVTAVAAGNFTVDGTFTTDGVGNVTVVRKIQSNILETKRVATYHTETNNIPDFDNVMNLDDVPAWVINVADPIQKTPTLATSDASALADPIGKIDLTALNGGSTWTAVADTADYIVDTSAALTALSENQTASYWDYTTAGTKPVNYYVQDNAGNKTYGTGDILGTTFLDDTITFTHSTGAINWATAAPPANLAAGDLVIANGKRLKIIDAADPGIALNLDGNGDVAAGTKAYVKLAGYDLKKPKATSVEVYSYSATATSGQTGYAPVIDRGWVANIAAVDLSTTYYGVTFNQDVTFTTDPTNSLSDVAVGDLLVFDKNATVGQTLVEVTAIVDADTLTLKMLQVAGETYGAADTLEFADKTMFKGLDYTLLGADTLVNAKDLLDDNDTETAEIIKITFDEALYVGDDLLNAVNGAIDNADGNLGTTINDTSVVIKMYQTDGQTVDVVSVGPKAATTGADDGAQLGYIKNFAYVESGTSITGTSVVYIIIQSPAIATATGANTGISAIPAINDGVTGIITSLTATFTESGLTAGDLIEFYEAAAPTTQRTFEVVSIDSDTQLTVRNNTGANYAGQATANLDTISIAARHVPLGNHFQILFDVTAAAQYTRVADQHSNLIDAAVSNFLSGNDVISW